MTPTGTRIRPQPRPSDPPDSTTATETRMSASDPITTPPTDAPARGSTLHLDLPPTIGIAPAAVWCGLAVRIGHAAPDATTVGRATATQGLPDNGPAAERAWLCAVDERIRALMARHDATARAELARRDITTPRGASPFYVALAQVPLPDAWLDSPRDQLGQPGGRRRTTRPLARALARHLAEARGLYLALLLAYPGAIVTPPVNVRELIEQGSGVDKHYFPPTFIGPRKPTARFGPHDGAIVGGRARGDRGHEQTAYQAAGLAHQTHHTHQANQPEGRRA
jgi:hypothetical protein